MAETVRIDFISDIMCPWCVVGLWGLDRALENLAGEIEAEVIFHPFELSPDTPKGGTNLLEHMAAKAGFTREKSLAARAELTRRAAELGFTMGYSDDFRAYNTFDAHRLLHWAWHEGRQHALKRALFEAYFTENLAIDDPEVLAGIAERVGLDRAEARRVLDSGRFAEEVRAEEALWPSRGIQGVPAVIVDQRYLISGGQPPEVFEDSLRRIVAQRATA